MKKIYRLLEQEYKNGNLKKYWVDCQGNLRETKTDKIVYKRLLKF